MCIEIQDRDSLLRLLGSRKLFRVLCPFPVESLFRLVPELTACVLPFTSAGTTSGAKMKIRIDFFNLAKILVFIVSIIDRSSCLYEDQVGKFDW